jgi:hypothetical protein
MFLEDGIGWKGMEIILELGFYCFPLVWEFLKRGKGGICRESKIQL